jgi:hypothetical protein
MIATVSLSLLYLIFQQVLGLVLGGAGSGDRARRAVVVEPCGRIGTT